MDLAQTRGKIWREMRRKEWEFFRFERLNKHQEEALRLVVESKSDVFVNLPTGFGKSVIFQVLSGDLALSIVYSYVKKNKLEPKKPDALAGYSMCTCTAALFLPWEPQTSFFPQNDTFTDRGTN